MSYRKHLMTRDEPPSELYKAAEVGTNLAEVGTDLISRKAAINYFVTNVGFHDEDGYPIEDTDELRKIWTEYFSGIPSAEPHWIPVEQDTPKEDNDYWATFDAETGRFVDWCSWYQGRWTEWTNDTVSEVSNVIAWCKPIEPYKRGDGMSDGINENQEYCYLRLPCGICRLTMTNCPKVSEIYSITPTWVSANCEVNIHTNKEVTE